MLLLCSMLLVSIKYNKVYYYVVCHESRKSCDSIKNNLIFFWLVS